MAACFPASSAESSRERGDRTRSVRLPEVSRRGVVGPLQLRLHHTATVGALIKARTADHDLTDTPLAALPILSRKLSAAAKRNRRFPDPITLWAIERGEALAGFHYLSLFTNPTVPKNFLTTEEADAVREVALALVTALLARRGAKKLDRAAVERWLQVLAPTRNVRSRAA